jgi:hypothetical protein
MHDLVERFTKCKPVFLNCFLPILFSNNYLKAVKKFCLFADEKLPKLKNKKYSDYKLEPGEWGILDLVQEVLAV